MPWTDDPLCKKDYKFYHEICDRVWNHTDFNKLKDYDFQTLLDFKEYAEECRSRRLKFNENCRTKWDAEHLGAVVRMENIIFKIEKIQAKDQLTLTDKLIISSAVMDILKLKSKIFRQNFLNNWEDINYIGPWNSKLSKKQNSKRPLLPIKPPQNNYCDICDVNVPFSEWNKHVQGYKHTLKINRRDVEKPLPTVKQLLPPNPPQNNYCDICDVNVPFSEWNKHVQGYKHTLKINRRDEENLLLDIISSELKDESSEELKDERDEEDLILDLISKEIDDEDMVFLQTLKDGIDHRGIEHTDSNGETPLIIASQLGYLGSVDFLLSNGANINAVNKKRQSALHTASYYGQNDVIQVLFRLGGSNIEVFLKDDMGKSALDVSKDEKTTETIMLSITLVDYMF
jgi:hypothetical protein